MNPVARSVTPEPVRKTEPYKVGAKAENAFKKATTAAKRALEEGAINSAIHHHAEVVRLIEKNPQLKNKFVE